MRYRVQRNRPSGWWLVLEETEDKGFVAVASFQRREDAELWKLKKEEDRKREEVGL